ncbi:MAG: hypothetical protein PVH19_12975 [Planctomycetia bacterium]|jgi:hypothetical protein
MSNEQLDQTQTENKAAEEMTQEDAFIEASVEFLESWNRLISTTNWDKGRIISRWRAALQTVGAPVTGYSDEAWSRTVGNVTPQHVGRLRRVYDRFNETYQEYDGLYWSHFQAALDWDDAEMWLEGAVQGKWSVAVMRSKRWEAIGAPADQKPKDEDIIVAEIDEDVSQDNDSSLGPGDAITDSESAVNSADDFDPDAPPTDADAPFELDMNRLEDNIDPVRPFEDLPELPQDLADAVEALKLAIVQHKMNGWRDTSADDVLCALNALKQLALAPS